jgi:uncharacterized zinc-type alcohol dehydrogenase-like protein
MGAFVNLLALGGTLVDVGLMNPQPPLAIAPLAKNRRRVVSSLAGGIGQTQSMIRPCAPGPRSDI